MAPAHANSTKEEISDVNMLLELNWIINHALKYSGQEQAVIIKLDTTVSQGFCHFVAVSLFLFVVYFLFHPEMGLKLHIKII